MFLAFIAGPENLPVSFSYKALLFLSTLSRILLKIVYLLLSTFSGFVSVTRKQSY